MIRQIGLVDDETLINRLTAFERFILPLCLTSKDPKAREMIYTSIRLYNGQSLPNTDGSMRVQITRYFHQREVQTFLMVYKSEHELPDIKVGYKKKENIKDNNEEAIDVANLTREGHLQYLLGKRDEAEKIRDEKLTLDYNKQIASIQGWTREQKEETQTKNIYVPITCFDCPLYKEKNEILKQVDNDNTRTSSK